MAGDMTHTLTPDLGTPVISCSKTFNLFHELSIFELKPVESSSSLHDSNVICLEEGGGKKRAREVYESEHVHVKERKGVCDDIVYLSN